MNEIDIPQIYIELMNNSNNIKNNTDTYTI